MKRVTGKQALIELLRGENVEYVFGIPGATEILFMDALDKAGDIKYILGLNEIICAGMAEGYARAAGKPGFLNLHTGPGVAASLPMLYNARAGGVPVVITAGQQDSRLLQYEPHLSGDIVGMAKLYTKWCTEIAHADDIPAVIQRAFKTAIQAPAGPVLVSVPQNILAENLNFEYKPNTTVYPRIRPDRQALDSALKILKNANKPVVFVESGVSRSGALNEVTRFAELIGAPVYQFWMSDVNFPVNHPQYLGDLDPYEPAGVKMLKDSDVIIGIGCSMFDKAFYQQNSALPEGVKTIHIDDNPWEIGKNIPADCGIQADIKAAVYELNQAIENEFTPSLTESVKQRIKEISEEKALNEKQLEKQIEEEKDRIPISVSRLMKEIREAMTKDTVVVDDCWSSSPLLRRILDLERPGQFFRSRKGGSIGWGLPGGLGVKLGNPDQKVIVVSGDGSAAWSMQTFWTAARYNIPVTFVITNNATYRQVKLVRKAVLGDYPLNERHDGMELDEPVTDFCMLAQSMGVKGEKVSRPDDLNEALQKAMDSDEPRLVEVFVENRP